MIKPMLAYKLNENKINFKEFIALIFRHKNLIFLSTVLLLIISLYYTFTITPVFKSSISLMIKENLTETSGFDFTGRNKLTEIENERLLIKSRVVSENVVKKLWNSENRDNLHILDTRDYKPRGQGKREFFKKITLISKET